ncbi:MAG: P-loop NTPase, partial [Clostridia bacterium]|nr:P-loop NTPase [Clostridia bacterium]
PDSAQPDMLPVRRAEIRVVTSAKGGVGKSTVCANVGAALAQRGLRVLLIDCDTTNRCLDLLTGMEDEALLGLRDVLDGACTAQDAILPCNGTDGLFLLPGSSFASASDGYGAIANALGALTESLRGEYDHILIDTPGGMQDILTAAAAAADEILIVSSAQTTAIRSAEHTAALLAAAGAESQRLIINQFMAADALLRGHRSSRTKKNSAVMTLFETVDAVALTLLGVIPFDASLWDAQNRGQLITDPLLAGTPFAAACKNIAARLCRHSVPLFQF